jgi:fatty acid desaturase
VNSSTNLTSVARRGRESSVSADPAAQGFSLREAKELIEGLFSPKPAVYWSDFLITVSIAYGFAAMYIMAPAFSLIQITALLVSGVALFRVGTFIHEIVHMPRGSMVGFRIAWNLICGVPSLMHSLLYSNHLDHHNPRKYGTPADGEYLPLASAPIRETVLYLAQVPVLPILAVCRFLVLVPLSFLHPRLRRWLLERGSSYGTNPYYRRTIPPTERQDLWVTLDLSCFLWLVVVLALVLKGFISWATIGLLYALVTYSIGLNWVRTLAAHRYGNIGREMTFSEQMEDSVTIEGCSLATLLLFPVGLRYHALHHLFPSLPYHAMGKAHRQLMNALPEDSPYRKTCCPGFFTALRELARSAIVAGKRGQNPMQLWRSAKAEK